MVFLSKGRYIFHKEYSRLSSILIFFYFSYSAQQVLGVPNVVKYGDEKKAWKQGKNRGTQEEYLHVSSDFKVFNAELYDL